MPIEPFLDALDLGALRPTYGDRLPRVLNWARAVGPHQRAFPNLSVYTSREGVLHVVCPVPGFTSAAGHSLALDLRVPPQFPEAGTLQPRIVRADTLAPLPRGSLQAHPAVDWEGQVRLKALPEFAAPNAERGAPLADVLVALCVVLSHVAPVQPGSASGSVGSTDPTPSLPSPTAALSSAPPPPPSTSAPSVPPQPLTTPPMNSQLAAPPAVFVAAAEQYLREAVAEAGRAAATAENLAATMDTLQRLRQSLADKNRNLVEAQQEIQHMALLCARVSESRPADALSCIEPADALSRQGFDLLAEIEACDDALVAMERRLKKGGYPSAQAYIRAVSEVARRQFTAKFLLRKVLERKEGVRTSATSAAGGSV